MASRSAVDPLGLGMEQSFLYVSGFLGEVLHYTRRVREGNQKDLILRVRRSQELLDGFPSTVDFRCHAATHIENQTDRHRCILTEKVFDLLWLLAFVQSEVSLVQAYYDAIHSVSDGHWHKH
jgi:hypothetical protein